MSPQPTSQPLLNVADFVGAALEQVELDRVARETMDHAGRLVSAWTLARDAAPRLSLGPDEVYATLSTIPANMLVLLESPEGWSTLSGMVAYMCGLTPVPYSPTVH